MVEALLVLAIDGLGGRLSEALTVEVLTAHLRNITLIARNVLSLDVLVGAADPVLALLRGVAILQLIVLDVLRSQVHVVIVLVEVRLANGDVDVVSRRLLLLLRDQLVDITGRAAIDLVLLGHVASVARQVLLIVLDEGLGRHFLQRFSFVYFFLN